LQIKVLVAGRDAGIADLHPLPLPRRSKETRCGVIQLYLDFLPEFLYSGKRDLRRRSRKARGSKENERLLYYFLAKDKKRYLVGLALRRMQNHVTYPLTLIDWRV
jgi:hypothetical protein